MTVSDGSAWTAVVFDLDGVVLDSEHLWEEMWVAYAARRGTTWTATDTTHVQGMSAPEWAGYLAAHAGGDAAGCEREVVDGMVAALEAGRMEPYPGAPEMLRECGGRAPIALATSAPRRLIDAVLDRHGLTAAFRATVSSAEVDRGKPSPDVYLEAARRIRTAPGSCVAVEDSGNGIRAAHAAGMTVVALPNPTYPPAPDALALAFRVAEDVHGAHREVVRLLDGATTASPPR